MAKNDYFILDTETHPIDAAMWHQARRPELLGLFRREVYGQPLPRPAQMQFEVVREDPRYLGAGPRGAM